MNESKPNNRGIKFIAPSLLMVMLAFIFAVTATFAWISMSRSSRVSGILFQVTSREGLQVSVKRWKFKEVSANKIPAEMLELVNTDDVYYYTKDGQSLPVSQQNIYNLGNKQYIFIAQIGETAVEIPFNHTVKEGNSYYVFCTDTQSPASVINANLYENITGAEGSTYTLTGDVLCEPDDEDFALDNNTVTEELLAKVCMNNKNATKITDPLTNATTPIDENGNAISIINLTEKDGSGFMPNALTAGDRYTANFAGGMSATTVYKYQFDLYFRSITNQAIVLATQKSSVGSDAPSAGRRRAKAWADLLIDNYTDNLGQKNLYNSMGNGEYVPNGAEILAQSKNALRVGISDAAGAPISIWDPNSQFGWTKNNPENNMALHYYNQAMAANLNRGPANATLSDSTVLIHGMTKIAEKDYRASVKITVWLEGYDADCLDSITSEVLNIKLSFAGIESKTDAA